MAFFKVPARTSVLHLSSPCVICAIVFDVDSYIRVVEPMWVAHTGDSSTWEADAGG